MSDGRTDDIAQAQSIAEVALHTYAENRVDIIRGLSDTLGTDVTHFSINR